MSGTGKGRYFLPKKHGSPKPIDTAPKDETTIYVYEDFWMEAYWSLSRSCWLSLLTGEVLNPKSWTEK